MTHNVLRKPQEKMSLLEICYFSTSVRYPTDRCQNALKLTYKQIDFLRISRFIPGPH